MKLGDPVKTIGPFAGLTGIVTGLRAGHDIEDHGMVEVTLVTVDSDSYDLEPGDKEHFVYYQWEQFLEIIE